LSIYGLLSVIPAQAGIQLSSSVYWIPVFTGMTIQMPCYTHAHDWLLSSLKEKCIKDQPTISQTFASPQGEGFPPSPKGTLISFSFLSAKDIFSKFGLFYDIF